MICPEFEALTHQEKISFIGKLVHAVQNDSFSFNKARRLISSAYESGVFKDVVINPPQTSTDDPDT